MSSLKMNFTEISVSSSAASVLVVLVLLAIFDQVLVAAVIPNPATSPSTADGAPKVCSGQLIASNQELLAVKRQECQIINGSLLLIGLYPDMYPKGLLSLPTVHHITGIAIVHLVFTQQLRTILPNLVAVHGAREPDRPYETDPAMKEAYRRGVLTRVGSGAALSENITLLLSLNAVMSHPDLGGIAIYNGVVALGNQNKPVYFVQTYLPENSSACEVSTQTSSADDNATCCVESYSGEAMCPAANELGCLTAPTFQAPNTPGAYCTYYGNDLVSCVSSCSQNTSSLFLGRFCINRCPNIVHPLTNTTAERYYSFKAVQGYTCLSVCPPDFQGNDVTATCDSCLSSQSRCIKYCRSTVVRSLTQLCNYIGCTHMNGDLILNINNPGFIPDCLRNNSGVTTVESALIRAFGKVRVINGILFIVNNLCIYDLSFLHSLEEINSPHAVFWEVRLYINQNNQLTSLKGLEKLKQIGGVPLNYIYPPFFLTRYIYITSNSHLCPKVIQQFYLDRTGFTNFPLNNVTLFTVNGDGLLCPITNFPLTARGVDSTTIELSWQPDSLLGIVYSQYIFYVEARNNTDKDFRQIASTSLAGDFSCIARLERSSTIELSGLERKLNVTNLRPCSEYAFQIEVLYNIAGYIVTANSSQLILGRPLLPKDPPPPNTVKINVTTATFLQLIWQPPDYQCQDYGDRISYKVFWKKMVVVPPAETLSFASCGKACDCATNVAISTTKCIGSLLEKQQIASLGYQLVSGGRGIASLQAQYHRDGSLRTRITPPNCNQTSETNCCDEGLAVRLGTTSFNDTGVWAEALSETTYKLSLNIPIEPLTVFESYVISVQAVHGSRGMSSSTWALAASIPPPRDADLVEKFKVSSDEDGVCLEWLPPKFQNSPPIVYQLIMSSAKSSMETSEQQATCLQDYCMAYMPNCTTVNMTSRTAVGVITSFPVAAIADILPSLVATQNGMLRFCLHKFTCSSKDTTVAPGSHLLLFFQLRQITLAGCGPWSPCASLRVNTSDSKEYNTKDKSESSGLSSGQKALISVLSITAFISAIVTVFMWKSRQKSHNEMEQVRLMMERLQQGYGMLAGPDGACTGDDYSYEPDEWERSLQDITLLKPLGEGQFGQVFHGTIKEKTKSGKVEEVDVAIKTVHDDAKAEQRRQFLKEACLMKVLNNEHLVQLRGIISGPETYVIMEYMPNGDLKHYLRAVRPNKEQKVGKRVPDSNMFKSWGCQLAQGMAFLTERKCVHRDLAARNCMIDGSYCLRVGDFGLARDVYVTDYYRRGSHALLPLRWLAPESIQDGFFTSQSDVWSYGVVLWEMATLAQQPYRGLSNEEVVTLVIKGGRMDTPTPELPFPDNLLRLMPQCWQTDSNRRPTFPQLVELLQEDEHYV